MIIPTYSTLLDARNSRLEVCMNRKKKSHEIDKTKQNNNESLSGLLFSSFVLYCLMLWLL